MGCTTPQKIQNVDTKESYLTTIRWGESDLQEIAESVVTNILSSSNIDFSKNYNFGKIKNHTHDHIDIQRLTNKITTSLIKSGKIKIIKENSPKKEGIFFGKISSIFKKNKRTKDIFFNFNLTLTELKTSKIIWSYDVPIRKMYNNALFGW